MHEGYNLVKEVYLMLDDGDQRFLSRYGLTQVQYYALSRLTEAPKKMSELSRDLLCDPSNVTRVAGILERKGLISRKRGENDRRVVRLTLTAEGEALIEEVREAHDEYTRQRMTILTEDDKASLMLLLNKLGDGLQEQLESLSFL